MKFTQEVATDLSFPNITVYRKFRDGEVCAYIAEADDGYAMYDKSTDDFAHESPEGETAQISRCYYRKAIFPLSMDFSKFTWEAVSGDTINNNLIF